VVVRHVGGSDTDTGFRTGLRNTSNARLLQGIGRVIGEQLHDENGQTFPEISGERTSVGDNGMKGCSYLHLVLKGARDCSVPAIYIHVLSLGMVSTICSRDYSYTLSINL
jgi:hypothetical protein